MVGFPNAARKAVQAYSILLCLEVLPWGVPLGIQS